MGSVGKDGEENDFSRVYGNRTWNFKERLVYTPTDKLRLTGRLGYFFRERDKSTSSKDRYRDFSGGLRGNYTFSQRNGLELSYSFDQYDKSDFDPVQDYDLRDYTNVQHTLRALYNHSLNERNTLIVGGDFMRDYLMSYQFTDNGSHEQYTADAFAQFDLNPVKNLNIMTAVRFDYYSEADVKNTSSKLGIMYKWRNCSLRASYAGGFRAPTLKEMYMDFNMANLAFSRIPEEPLQRHADRLLQPGGQPHHHRMGPNPRRNGLLEHRADEHLRTKRRRRRQIPLRAGCAPLVCLYPRPHPQRRTLLLLHPTPHGYREDRLWQGLEELRLRRNPERARALAGDHRRIRRLRKP